VNENEPENISGLSAGMFTLTDAEFARYCREAFAGIFTQAKHMKIYTRVIECYIHQAAPEPNRNY
jgi:hypothetical protein